MSRAILLAGGAVVALGAIGLVVAVRSGERPSTRAPAPASSSPGDPTSGPLRMPATPTMDASVLPTPEEEAEARARVLDEYERPPNAAPDMVKTNQTVKPMREARDAYKVGDYPLALSRAEDVLALEPDDRQARMYAVMAACGMNEVAKAQAHADRMIPSQKVRAAKKCQRHGVALARVPTNVPEDAE